MRFTRAQFQEMKENGMKNRRLTLGIYYIAVLLIAIAATALKTVAVVGHLDFDTGYFSENVYITIGDWLIIGAVLLGVSYVFFGNSTVKLIPSFDGAATYIPSAAVAVALLFMAVELFSKGLSGTEPDWLTLICALFTLPAILGFFFTVLRTQKEDTGRGWFCLSIVIFMMIYSAFLYFDSTLPLNSPNKTVDRMAFLAATAFFLFETRISLGREKWRGYTVFGLIGGAVTLYSSAPALAIYFINGEIISNSLYESVLVFTVFVFISARLVTALLAREDKENEFVAFIKENESAKKPFTHAKEDYVSEESANYSIDFDGDKERNRDI